RGRIRGLGVIGLAILWLKLVRRVMAGIRCLRLAVLRFVALGLALLSTVFAWLGLAPLRGSIDRGVFRLLLFLAELFLRHRRSPFHGFAQQLVDGLCQLEVGA